MISKEFQSCPEKEHTFWLLGLQLRSVQDKRSSILELEKRYGDIWDSSEYSESVSSPRESDFTLQQYTPIRPEDGEVWRPDGAHEQH